MTIYDEIIEVANEKDWTPKYEFFLEEGSEYQALKMVGHYHPVSIKINEFNRIKNFVIENNYTRGYEIATAFGISGLAAALGFKETGGKLVTMDAYIEERYNHAGAYIGKSKELHTESDGMKSVTNLTSHFDLHKTFDAVVGWSPDDVAMAVDFGHGPRFSIDANGTPLGVEGVDNPKVDFVFIDALHTSEAFCQDLLAIEPFLAEHAGLLVHDSHMFHGGVHHLVRSIFGQNMKIFDDCVRPLGWNLAYVTR